MSLKKHFIESVFILVLGLVVSSFALFPSYTFASSPSAFHISQLQNGVFEEKYTSVFPVKYTTKDFNFNNLNDSLTLKINESGDLPYSGVDAIILNACGSEITPSSAFYSDTNESVLEDVLKLDLNVVISHEKPIQISWNLPQGCSIATLSINANEYGVANPFRFPVNGNASYTFGSNNGGLVIDGKINETDGTTPLYTPYWTPSTGHPEGNVYLYAKDDSNYLYFAADIAIDNTNDYGPDWISITIGGREFKVTDADDTYGKCSFGLTSKVSYKHQTCELKIPKNQINYTNNTVPFVLGYYGTGGGGEPDISAPTFGPPIGTTGTPGETTRVGVTVNDNVSVASAEISFDNGITYIPMIETPASITRNQATQRRYTYDKIISEDQATNIDYIIRASDDGAGNLATLTDTILIEVVPTFAGGSGTSGSPYQIETCQQLQDINYTPDGANYPFLTEGNYFILNNNIPCEETSEWTEKSGNTGFTPIGSSGNQFSGNFNGNNKIISGLFMNHEYDFVGLFGFTALGSNILNVGLENVDITGGSGVGGLAGVNYGTITNSYATGNVIGNNYVGGLVGVTNTGNISNSYATGDVTGNARVGGLVGNSQNGNISNSYSTGNVTGTGGVGGLVGDNSGGEISNSYSTGNVTGTDRIGGLVGYDSSGNISNSYSVGSVTGESNVGGLIGNLSYNTDTNTYSDFVSNSGWYQTEAETNMKGIGTVSKELEVSELEEGAEVTYKETDNTVFYSKTHGVYTQGEEAWDFTTPIWYEYTDNYPQFVTQGNVIPPPTRHHVSSGSSAGAIAQFKIEQQQLVTPVISPTPTPTTNPTPLNITRTLRLNMTGDDVKALQIYLNTAGFNCGIVDGKFGPKTKAGVILFQKANNLIPDGIVGPKTRGVMK